MIRRAILSGLVATGIGCGLLLPEVSDLAATGHEDGGGDGQSDDGGSRDAEAETSLEAGFDPCDGASPTTVFANLFVVGGFASDEQGDAAVSRDVLRASLFCDGHAGEFSVVAALPQALIGPAVAVLNGHLVVVGGHTLDGSLTSNGYVARAADGGWEPFQTVAGVDAGFRDGLQFASNGTFLVLMGGFVTTGVWLGDVELLRVAADGAITTTSSPVPMPARASGQAAFTQGVLFVGGGQTSTAGDVQASLSADGAVGSWMPSGTESSPIVDGVALGDENTCLFLGRPGGIQGTVCAGFRAVIGQNEESPATPSEVNLVNTRGAATVAHGFAYFIGGQEDGGLPDGKYVRVADFRNVIQTAHPLPPLPYGRYGHRLVVY